MLMNRIVKNPINLIVLFNLLCGVLLFIINMDDSFRWIIIAEYSLVLIIILISSFFVIKKDMGDEYLLIIVSMLISIGFAMLTRLDKNLGLKQIVWFLAGNLLFFTSYFLFNKIKNFNRYIYFYAGISYLVFIVTLVFGTSINGSKNWIIINNFSFQPSEIIKILFILFLACSLNDKDKLYNIDLFNFRFKLSKKTIYICLTYLFVFFLIMQREWGTALLLFMIYFGQYYVSNGRDRFLLLQSSIAVVTMFISYKFIYHIRVRVDTWLNPWSDIAGKGYQITQSLFAIGSGGFFGTGLGLGRPDLIPEVKTDFIFSAICEEMGIFGGVSIILLYFILSYRGIKIVMSVREPLKRSIALGITLMYGFQTFIIIGGVIKAIPLTGITLPFISYGGSSLTTSFIALGILQAISKPSGAEEDLKLNE